MKTAEEILDNNYPLDFITERVKGIIIMAMKEYALEACREALKNASENAKLSYEWSHEHMDVVAYVDKQSILNESNIPAL